LFAACGGDDDGGGGGSSSDGTTTGEGKKGGSAVFAAEQWPECINPITQCSNSSWLQWLVPIHVLPRLMELDEKNNFVASPLLTEAPTLDNGGIEEGPPFKVTFKLNPDAKWDDGTPITSEDVEFSWQAVLKTKGSLSTAGYEDIESIDTTDPQTAVLTWKRPYTDWQDVMGGFQGIILQKSKFKSADTSKDMAQTIGFSGGPWILESFSQDQLILKRNENYWDADRIPLLDQVTFVPRTEISEEVNAVTTGQALAIYPQPTSGNVPDLTSGDPLSATFGATTQYEGLWFNQKPGKPFADDNVRAAFVHAFDRQKFLDDIVKPFFPDVEPLNCAAWVPGVGDWCDQDNAAAKEALTFDSAKVEEFMGKAGYAKDGDGIWAKDGQQLRIKWSVNTDNERRLDTQTEFIPELRKQGFLVETDNFDADTLFQQKLPAGDYDFSMFIQVTSPDPSATAILHTDQIPGPENEGQGQNQWWYSNTDADKLMEDSDSEFDTAARVEQIHELNEILISDYVTLPLYVFPSMGVWRNDRLEGPIDQFIDSPESIFWNMYDWSLK
jgi:peptide/nickel transport system substrate-binding protein